MKQLLILSGKGGTGKTTVASALIHLFKAKAFADCDVDAPNLYLVFAKKGEPKRSDFYGLKKAFIDPEKCISCGLCFDHCRFSAIQVVDQIYRVEDYACEGCAVCQFVCPVEAVIMNPSPAGELQLYQNPQMVFSTAQLKMGSGNSGLLVSEVKKQMREAASEPDLAIIDGSPGIGCPVIASLSGVDWVLIVTEPSVSGISDLQRIVKTATTFQVPVLVCINKADTSPEKAEEIMQYCDENGIQYVGSIPFDPLAVKAINQGISIIEIPSPSGEAVRKIYKKLEEIIDLKENDK